MQYLLNCNGGSRFHCLMDENCTIFFGVKSKGVYRVRATVVWEFHPIQCDDSLCTLGAEPHFMRNCVRLNLNLSPLPHHSVGPEYGSVEVGDSTF